MDQEKFTEMMEQMTGVSHEDAKEQAKQAELDMIWEFILEDLEEDGVDSLFDKDDSAQQARRQTFFMQKEDFWLERIESEIAHGERSADMPEALKQRIAHTMATAEMEGEIEFQKTLLEAIKHLLFESFYGDEGVDTADAVKLGLAVILCKFQVTLDHPLVQYYNETFEGEGLTGPGEEYDRYIELAKKILSQDQ